mgnify:CR=1 FL=1
MIGKFEIDNKIKYREQEYSVILYNEASFKDVVKTLRYPSGIMKDSENFLIECDEDDYKKIFIENGDRILHFYADIDGTRESRRRFIDTIMTKYGTNHSYTFIIVREDAMLSEVRDVCDDLCIYDNAYVCVLSDEDLTTNHVRIVIGT